METIEIDRLADSACAFTSGETFNLVLRQRDLICASESSLVGWNSYLRKFWHLAKTNRFKLAAIEFLGRLALYDFVAIEYTAVRENYDAKNGEWLTLVKTVSIPKDVYEMAGDLATNAFYLKNKKWEKRSEYGFIEKRHMDSLAAGGVSIREALRNSEYPGTRLYFYIVLSALYRVPLVLDYNKNEALKHFASDLRSSVHDTFADIEKALADPIRKKLKEKLNEIGEEIPLQVPPLVNYIFRIAEKHKLSLWDATLKIRETNDAKAFRKYLHELERARAGNSEKELLAYQKQLQKIHDLGRDWAENLSASYRITQSRSHVPPELMASLLNLGSFNTMAELQNLGTTRDAESGFSDPALPREPHMVFLSKLFELEDMK